MPPFDREKFIANLVQIHALLEASEIRGRWWLVGGLVLGLYREGKILPNDRDADFGIWEEDETLFLRSIRGIEKAGFRKKYRWVNSGGRVTEYTFEKDGAKFEFFIHFRKPGERIEWFAYRPSRLLELQREAPLYGLRAADYWGRTWLIPADTEAYLEQQYGNWRVPDSKYDYSGKRSVPCNVGRRFWLRWSAWR